jgi:isobutyryl-CoA mutase
MAGSWTTSPAIFRNPHGEAVAQEIVLIRPTEAAKQSQLKRLREIQKRNAKAVPAMMKRL